MMILLTKDQKRLLQFFRIKDYESEEERSLLKRPFFKLKFQHDVRDFYMLKENILNYFDYKSFLIICTAQNFIIYRESKRNIIKKIFALPNPCNDLRKYNFSLMYKVEGNYDKTVHDIKGVFFSLSPTSVSISVISNLFQKKQALLEENFSVDLLGFPHDQIVTVIVQNLEIIKLVTISEELILMKYKIRNAKPKPQLVVESFKLIDNAIDAEKFIYSRNCNFVYGVPAHQELFFKELQIYFKKKYQFAVLKIDEEILKNSFWTLLNQDVFLKIDLEKKQMETH